MKQFRLSSLSLIAKLSSAKKEVLQGIEAVKKVFNGRHQNLSFCGKDAHQLIFPGMLKTVRTPVAILGSLGVCIYVPASRHWLISYSPIHLT